MSEYRRILLKLSGEALMAGRSHGIDSERMNDYIEEIIEVSRMGIQVGIVIGGGNIYRGLQAAESGIERVQGDYMGMMATVINGMALQSALEKIDVFTRLVTAIEMREIAETYATAGITSSFHEGAEWMYELLATTALADESRDEAKQKNRSVEETLKHFLAGLDRN